MASQLHAPFHLQPRNWGPTQTHLHQLVLVLLRDTWPHLWGKTCPSQEHSQDSPPPVSSDILFIVLATAASGRQSAHPAPSQLSSVSTTCRQHPRDWGVTRFTWPITYLPGSPRSAAAPCCAGGSSPTCYWWQWHQTPASPPPTPTPPACPAETGQRPCREG